MNYSQVKGLLNELGNYGQQQEPIFHYEQQQEAYFG